MEDGERRWFGGEEKGLGGTTARALESGLGERVEIQYVGLVASKLLTQPLSIFPNDITAPENKKVPLRSSFMVAVTQGGPSVSFFVKCKRKWLTCHVKLLAWPLTAKLEWTGADLAHSKEMVRVRFVQF
ncbi:hypothetical protein PIB30_003663 [Stylosanthes scabra]|uniref:Uncharacterized protein n=1 Tax=Stylosanthes scabra TaxID=79078 RepID=A0ABU6Z069_9FABA|nr:hypothetical protein [Stylosanthes scabra]